MRPRGLSFSLPVRTYVGHASRQSPQWMHARSFSSSRASVAASAELVRLPCKVNRFCYHSDMDYSKIITIEPGKRSGKPTIRGTRMTVTDVLDYLAGGMSEEEIWQTSPT